MNEYITPFIYGAIGNENHRGDIEEFSTIKSIDHKTNNYIIFNYFQQFPAPCLGIVEFLAIEIDSDIDISNFKNMVVTIESIEILHISFSLLYKLCAISIYEKSLIITFPKYFFTNNGNKFPLYIYPDNKMTFSISSEFDLRYRLHVKYTNFTEFKKKESVSNFIQNYRVKQYKKQHIGILNINKIDYPQYIYGFFIESKMTKIKEIKIECNPNYSNDKYLLQQYNYYALNSLIINKYIWNNSRSRVFNILMSNLLPPEMVNYIESYICNTYLYYIPINLDNCKWNSKDPKNFMKFSPIIKFDKQYTGEIYSYSSETLQSNRSIVCSDKRLFVCYDKKLVVIEKSIIRE